MQYKAQKLIYVFPNLSRAHTPGPPFDAVTQNLLPSKILAAYLD